MSERKQFLVRIPADLHEKIIELAREEGVSLSQFVTDALESRIKNRKIPLIATEEGYYFNIPPGYWFEADQELE